MPIEFSVMLSFPYGGAAGKLKTCFQVLTQTTDDHGGVPAVGYSLLEGFLEDKLITTGLSIVEMLFERVL